MPCGCRFLLYIAIHNGITKVLANVERAGKFTIINTELLYQLKMILNVNKGRKILFLISLNNARVYRP